MKVERLIYLFPPKAVQAVTSVPLFLIRLFGFSFPFNCNSPCYNRISLFFYLFTILFSYFLCHFFQSLLSAKIPVLKHCCLPTDSNLCLIFSQCTELEEHLASSEARLKAIVEADDSSASKLFFVLLPTLKSLSKFVRILLFQMQDEFRTGLRWHSQGFF